MSTLQHYDSFEPYYAGREQFPLQAKRRAKIENEAAQIDDRAVPAGGQPQNEALDHKH